MNSEFAQSICSSGVLAKLNALQLRLLFAMVTGSNPDGEVWASSALIIKDATGRQPNGRHYDALRRMERLGVIEIVRAGRDNAYRLRPLARADEPDSAPQGAQCDPYIGLVREARKLSRRRGEDRGPPPGPGSSIDALVREAIDKHGEDAVEELLEVASRLSNHELPFHHSQLRDPRRTIRLMRRLFPKAFPTPEELEAEEAAREALRAIRRR